MSFCVICLENINEWDSLILKCKHCYHTLCFSEFVEKNSTKTIQCPTCRTIVDLKIIITTINNSVLDLKTQSKKIVSTINELRKTIFIDTITNMFKKSQNKINTYNFEEDICKYYTELHIIKNKMDVLRIRKFVLSQETFV